MDQDVRFGDIRDINQSCRSPSKVNDQSIEEQLPSARKKNSALTHSQLSSNAMEKPEMRLRAIGIASRARRLQYGKGRNEAEDSVTSHTPQRSRTMTAHTRLHYNL